MINGTESMGIGTVLSVDITLQSCTDNRIVHGFKLTDEFVHQFPQITNHHASLPIK